MRGARNAIENCLGVERDDRVVLICDEATAEVASALIAAIDERKASRQVFVLERCVERPVTDLPSEIWTALGGATVSLYAVTPQPGEQSHRSELVSKVEPLKLRHAHMVRITPDAMMQGMLADYRRIGRLNELMIERLSKASLVRIRSAKGTDIIVDLDPSEPWDSSAGIILPGHWYNLPNGEITTCPASVQGVFICDAMAPTESKVRSDLLLRKPLRIELVDGVLALASGGPPGLADEVGAMAAGESSLSRVGMFGVGTNFELLMPIGDPLQDMYLPGAYLALGSISTLKTPRVTWSNRQQMPFTARRTTLEIDGGAVIKDGRYVQALLDMI
jgi:leucyl aminopeptidase (aminopeptidase T)